MKKLHLTGLILFCIISIQATYAQKVGIIVTWDNESEEIQAYEKIIISDFEVKTWDEKGKLLKFKHSNVKRISAQGEEYVSMEVSGAMKRQLCQIVAKSPKYTLIKYFTEASQYWLIYDAQGVRQTKPTMYNFATAFKKTTLEKVKPYFADCPELIEKFQANLDIKGVQLFDGILGYECK